MEYTEKKIIINGKELTFKNESIHIAYDFDNIIIVVLKGDYPPLEKNYNNVLAFNKQGVLVWEVEKNDEDDFKNPYEGSIHNGSYLILFKAKGQRIAINVTNGKIIKNIDLISNSRPW